ncbi:hypothetical protein [Novosphingobium sp.]|uniref:hypothetical protein n=1 Tax=Novosphingobium sp. TaxID=1874826 RepID=UPI0035AEBBDE
MAKINLCAALLLLSAPVLAQENCPASLEHKVPGLSSKDAKAAQGYADCVQRPWLPVKAELAAKVAQCRTTLGSRMSRKLSRTLDWVDHIAAQFPGCETAITIKRTA